MFVGCQGILARDMAAVLFPITRSIMSKEKPVAIVGTTGVVGTRIFKF
jgi:hypothetical protein